MKNLATHPDLVRAWLLAMAGMPPSATPATQPLACAAPVQPGRPAPLH